MALTIKQLIEKLEQVENKNKDVFFETIDSYFSIDLVFIDKDKDIIFANVTELDDETSKQYKEMQSK